jgi:hypothetical protein
LEYAADEAIKIRMRWNMQQMTQMMTCFALGIGGGAQSAAGTKAFQSTNYSPVLRHALVRTRGLVRAAKAFQSTNYSPACNCRR